MAPIGAWPDYSAYWAYWVYESKIIDMMMSLGK